MYVIEIFASTVVYQNIEFTWPVEDISKDDFGCHFHLMSCTQAPGDVIVRLQ